MADKKSFVMYDTWTSLLCMLPDEDAGILIKAIGRYARSQELPDFKSDDMAFAFEVIKEQLDADNAKYEQKKARMLEAREKSKKHKPSEKTEQKTNKKAEQIIEQKPTEKSEQETGSVTDTVTVTVIPNGIKCVDSDESTRSKRGSDRAYLADCVQKWNELEVYGIPTIRSIGDTTERHRLFNARRKQYGDGFVDEIVERVRGSDFLQGRSKKPFMLTFDWAIKPRNCAKILEGNYANRGGEGRAGTTDSNNTSDYTEKILSTVNRSALGL